MLLTFTSKQNFSKYLLPCKIIQEDDVVSSYVPQTVTECTILMYVCVGWSCFKPGLQSWNRSCKWK